MRIQRVVDPGTRMRQRDVLSGLLKDSRCRTMKGIVIISWASLLLLESAAGEGGNWPRFRGPDGSGVAAGQEVPLKLGESTRAWSVSLPGPGSSSPVVWGNRVFVTSEDRARGLVGLHCYEAKTGTPLGFVCAFLDCGRFGNGDGIDFDRHPFWQSSNTYRSPSRVRWVEMFGHNLVHHGKMA